MAEEENMDTSGDPVSAGTTTVVERVVRMSLRPPPRFGAKGDWKLWLSRFEMYATQAKIAKDSWSKELLSLLEDEPYRMVTHHGLAQTGDYDAVCDCIQRSYAPLGSELEWQLKVRTRVQKVGESLMEFCGALRGMADKAFPAWPAEQLQDLLRNQFIQGVLSSSVQLALMKEEPKTLDDALKLACKHEMVETAQKHLQMLRQKEVVASTEGESSNSELLTATLRRDRERSEVETLRREVQRLSEKLKGGQRGRVDNSEEREKTGPVCWNCKSRGHVCTMQSDVWLPCWTLDELAEEQRQDSSIGQVIQWMENDSIPRVFPKHLSSHTQALWAQSSYLVLQNGVLYRRWEDVPCKGLHRRLQLVLPPTLVPVLLEALHSSIRGGHFGTSKTLAKVRERFYWVGQRKDVAAWCSGCLSCASRKPPPAKLRAPLQLDPAVRPLQRVAMDIMGPLPETSRGNKYILVIADYFTKWSEAYPIPNMEAITVAKCLVNEFICRFGVPEQLHSDQGRNFESKVIKNICDLLQIRKTRTSPYHPQSDGLVERFNRTLLNLLSIAVVDAERDWDVQLPLLMFAYRTSMHETNGVTPFEMMFGREVVLPEHLMFNLPVSTEQVLQEGVEYVDYLKKRFQLVHQYVRQNAQKGMQRQKTGYDQKENTRCVFRKGDHVWLYTPAVPKGKSPKFHRPWQGPYQVLKKKGEVTYDIRRLAHPRKRLIVHYNRLKPFLQASPPGEQEPSEEEEEEKEEKGTPSEEQESRGEEINKEPQESMADLQDEQYIYVETRRPEPGPAVEEHVPTPPLIAPAPRQPPQPPAEPELPQPGEQLRRSTRNRHPPHWYGHIVVHSAHTHTNCEDTVSLDGELL
eukprot:Em0017g697a